MKWYRPENLNEALLLLYKEQPQVVCGGTDLFVAFQRGSISSRNSHWMSIEQIEELQQVKVTEEGIYIGASVTAAQIWQEHSLQALTSLQEASRVIGGWQIQNKASIGGNLANASPAGDLIVPLAALNAKVIIQHSDGQREVTVEDFIVGPGQTQLRKDELITFIFIPRSSLGGAQTFLRHDQRGGTDISIVSVAAVKNKADQWVRVAVGAANAKVVVAQIDHWADQPDKKDEFVRNVVDNCHPITDIRASADYRLDMVRVFLNRALNNIEDSVSANGVK